ncbi:hypothetical protein G6F37_005864 [Rhizopus arrhizus]|nr:hypothetical protein G6F38_001767 [Rhizopus arrhizus]KAG1158372.1 hypothetical protein G6F37_005864 [Rhizopus arrhizus]
MVSYVITGTSRGLGLEFVKQISARGDTVFACARNPDKAEGLQKLVDGKKVHSIKLDTACEKSIKEAVEEISKLAPEGFDVLINNAGIGGAYTPPEQTSKKEILEIFETNVLAVNEVTNAFLPLLRKRGPDRVKKIVNMSSILGSVELAGFSEGTAYRISKSALNMLTKLQSIQLAKENIIVYASHPGWVKTDMGGENGDIYADESISGQLAKLDSVTAADAGKLINYKGEVLNY